MKNRNIYLLTMFVFLLIACSTEGVAKKENEMKEKKNSSTGKTEIVESKTDEKLEPSQKLLKPTSKKNEKNLEGGVMITWFEQGKGAKIKDEQVLKLNYEVRLLDGTIVDGNHLLKRDWLPFMVGYEMQTKGWEMAMKELSIGDFVEIYIPSKYARGEKGIKGVIPPNSDNIVRLRILEEIPPTKVEDGNKIWLLEENVKEKKKANLESIVDFHYMVSTKSNPKYDMSYRKGEPFQMRFSDFGIVKGLKKSLINAKPSDKLWIIVPSSEAYGSKGLLNLVKSNESLFYDIFIMDVR
jgi:FKBP-type peptidyl-prolyl cis-trans isomerase